MVFIFTLKFKVDTNPVSASLSNWLTSRPEKNNVIIWNEKLNLQNVVDIKPDIVISYSYQHIIKADVLNSLPDKFINLHVALLPYNRGADPNAWSFLENTPKGVSIHLIDQGIDTGRILIQKEVFFDETSETLGHSYCILQEEIQTLFRKHWDELRNGTIRAVEQKGKGSYHYAKEFAVIKDRLLGKEEWGVTIPIFRERYRYLREGMSIGYDEELSGMLAGNVFK